MFSGFKTITIRSGVKNPIQRITFFLKRRSGPRAMTCFVFLFCVIFREDCIIFREDYILFREDYIRHRASARLACLGLLLIA